MDVSSEYLINWINLKLAPRNIKIQDVKTDFKDGFTLVALLEEISKTTSNKKLSQPKNEILCLNNLQIGIDIAKQMVKNLTVDARNFYSGSLIDEKLIFGFIFDLIIHYSLSNIQNNLIAMSHASNDLLYSQFEKLKQHELSNKEALLLWINNLISKDNLKVSNFTTDWVNSNPLYSILNQFETQKQDIQIQFKENYQAENLPVDQKLLQQKLIFKKALDNIQQQIGVEQIISEGFVTQPQENAMITYLTVLYQQFCRNKKNQFDLNYISKFVQAKQSIFVINKQIVENYAECEIQHKIMLDFWKQKQETIQLDSQSYQDEIQLIIQQQSSDLKVINSFQSKYQKLFSQLFELNIQQGVVESEQNMLSFSIFEQYVSDINQQFSQTCNLLQAKAMNNKLTEEQDFQESLHQRWISVATDDKISKQQLINLLVEMDIDLNNLNIEECQAQVFEFEEFKYIVDVHKSTQMKVEYIQQQLNNKVDTDKLSSMLTKESVDMLMELDIIQENELDIERLSSFIK